MCVRVDVFVCMCVGVRMCACVCVISVEMKPELQRVLESRKRDQLIKQRKEEKEAHRKLSPLEAELMRRHRRLEEVSAFPSDGFSQEDSNSHFRLGTFLFSCFFLQLDEQLQKEQQEEMRAPEFIKVKENLRRTSLPNDEKEV